LGAAAEWKALSEVGSACARSVSASDFPCVAYAVDGLTRLASREHASGHAAESANAIAAFDRLWPRPDENLAQAKAMAKLRPSTAR
jgi:hypothetical protein